MNETKLAKIEFRQDTRENWESANPVLGIGEPGYDITQKMFKIGDGVSSWNALSYQTNNDTVIPEVPDDGKLYGRIRYPNNQSGSWSEVNIKGVEEAPLDTKYYSRQSGQWVVDPTNAKKFGIVEQRSIQINDNANSFIISETITKPAEESSFILSDSTKADILKLSLDTTGKLTLSTIDNVSTYVIYNGTNFVDANFTTTSEGKTVAVQFSAEKRTITITKSLTITSIDNLDIANIVFIEVPKEMDLIDVYNKILEVKECNCKDIYRNTFTFALKDKEPTQYVSLGNYSGIVQFDIICPERLDTIFVRSSPIAERVAKLAEYLAKYDTWYPLFGVTILDASKGYLSSITSGNTKIFRILAVDFTKFNQGIISPMSAYIFNVNDTTTYEDKVTNIEVISVKIN